MRAVKLGKRTTAEKLRFLDIAQGSLEESKYYLILSRDLQYGEVEELQLIAEAVGKLLAAYRRAISRAASPKRKAKRRADYTEPILDSKF